MEVYIVFTDTKTALSRVIQTYTQHSYSHVSLSFDRQLSDMYSFGRKDVDNAFIGGFVKEDPHNRLFQRAQCAVYRCEVTTEGYAKMMKFIRMMEQSQDQFKYNFTGLFGVMMNRKSERKNAFFCSQFVTETLLQGGIKISDKPANLVMPMDICRAKELDFVYSGAMNAYPFLEQAVLVKKEEYVMEVL
ncbi:hypothetical protein [Planococcus salinus]|uniref:Uncharacterized protein n=1 Tax=Planococcus salinus TaxID=1848460 RepID=A0A3M8PBY9_9BACL|nr:hypothetical protein [Planococcus salinus]RNF41238.1 hypothetical protein EEX84_02510 [Planococcus salinus]